MTVLTPTEVAFLGVVVMRRGMIGRITHLSVCVCVCARRRLTIRLTRLGRYADDHVRCACR